MLKVKASITLYKGENNRQTAFKSGYRPLFNFIEEMKKSGLISIIEKDQFYPGETNLVDILFLNDDYLGNDFGIGSRFTFGEGGSPLGEGEIKAIYESANQNSY
jgi:translation elongation factor EF-Tu-like GTPase